MDDEEREDEQSLEQLDEGDGEVLTPAGRDDEGATTTGDE